MRAVHRVARLLLGGLARGEQLGVRGVSYVDVNGQPGAVFVDAEDRPVVAVSLDIADGLVQTVRAVGNPDKLQHLYAFQR